MKWINGTICNHPSSTLWSEGHMLAHVYRTWNTWTAVTGDGTVIGHYGTKPEAQKACES